MTLRLYNVSVAGYGTSLEYARSVGAAKAKVWRCDAFLHLSFGEFLKLCRARLRHAPAPDEGYNYVRRNYGLDVRIGQRVTIQNEGPGSDGKTGAVAYPGTCTAHVAVILDDEDQIGWFHPDSVRIDRPSTTARAEP